MKRLIFIGLPVLLYSEEPVDLFTQFVNNYLLLAKSKVESSPVVWQDVKEGYLRNYTLRFTNSLLDSLRSKDLSAFNAGLRHLYKVDSLRIEIKKGGEYEHTIAPNDTPNFNINYFHSSSR
tara:strand:- start:114 stop:476 length:363 start_codon:yes stop_codon:yes gene_type:complete